MPRTALAVLALIVCAVVAGLLVFRRRPVRARAFSCRPGLACPAGLPAAFDLDKVARAGPGRIVITRETYADWVKPALRDQDFNAGQWFDALRGALLDYPAKTRGRVHCDYLVEGEAVVINVLRVSGVDRERQEHPNGASHSQ